MGEDIFKTFGAGSAVRLAQQAADSMDVRKQALGHLDEILNPSRHLARQVETSLDIVRRFAADSSLAAAKSVAAHDMQMVERLAQDVGYTDVMRAFEDVSTPAYKRFAQDYEAASLGFDDWMAQVDTREWAMRGLRSILANDLVAANRGLFDANEAIERVIKNASAQFPDLASPIEITLRSIDMDPTLHAARELAALLEQIRQEEGDAESVDEVESRLARLNLAALRRAVFAQLHRVLAGARKHGLDAVVALDVAYNSLTPLTQAITLELGKAVALSVLALSTPAQPVAPEPADVAAPARPADPLHRTSEILYSDSDVAMRTAPDHELPTFASVPARGFMRVVRRVPGWYLVSYVAADGHGAQVVGWVEANRLKSADAETVRLLWCALSDVPPPSNCAKT